MPAAIEAATAKNERGGKRYWPQIATAVLVPVLLLGMIEAALRLLGVGFPTDLTVACTVKGQAAACYNLFFPAPFFPPGMIKTPQAYAIPAEKPQGTFRIFVLGESAAMGDPDPAYGFSRYLEVMLRERYPAMNFEVVNTGSVAINSHVLLPIAEGLAIRRTGSYTPTTDSFCSNTIARPQLSNSACHARGMGSRFSRQTELRWNKVITDEPWLVGKLFPYQMRTRSAGAR